MVGFIPATESIDRKANNPLHESSPPLSEQGKVGSGLGTSEEKLSPSDLFHSCMKWGYDLGTRRGARWLASIERRLKRGADEFRKINKIPQDQKLTPEQSKAIVKLELDTPYQIEHEIERRNYCTHKAIDEIPLARGIRRFIRFGFPPVESNRFIREAINYTTLGVSDKFETLYKILQEEVPLPTFRTTLCEPDPRYILGTGLQNLQCKDGLAKAALRVVVKFVKRTNQ